MHFGFNSSSLDAGARSAVSTAAAYMADRPDAVVDVSGHTDPISSDADSHKLGGARANAVKTALS